MTDALDPRLNALRPDLADTRLRARVAAERFVAGEPARIGSGLADLRRAPSADAALDAQLWHGEAVRCFERREGWAWIQAEQDGYVGYTPAAGLVAASPVPPTHRVRQPMTFRFPEPSIKAPPSDRLPMGALLRVTSDEGDFLTLADGGYVFARHTGPVDRVERDWTATALRFLGTPYLWGGRSWLGIDCSGLAQTALLLAGCRPLRDSDMLRDAEDLGPALAPDSPRRRGDLLFSPGHVVMALDAEDIVHANAFHLATVREPFGAFVARLAARDEQVTSLRRPAL
ncbi:MAG: C40 family peptidase [Rhodospirillales bacterium]